MSGIAWYAVICFSLYRWVIDGVKFGVKIILQVLFLKHVVNFVLRLKFFEIQSFKMGLDFWTLCVKRTDLLGDIKTKVFSYGTKVLFTLKQKSIIHSSFYKTPTLYLNYSKIRYSCFLNIVTIKSTKSIQIYKYFIQWKCIIIVQILEYSNL